MNHESGREVFSLPLSYVRSLFADLSLFPPEQTAQKSLLLSQQAFCFGGDGEIRTLAQGLAAYRISS
ncbi:MAG: hypothetical protein IIV90_07970, partial [Oscillospiraceae bacterium]|nr:hypothetical protein [Oscillospiraceae bacterium]